ncbi:DUF1127 domain-containing protein [Ruegeria arenilitoris]|uniref:DUF1127 domain-containing protein n=1 Tax=Ruegeria arenilitoris TaxID=1173585 RepID=UPI00147E79CA|nr:DUF1127 domain-containing protein [Ruegeria arenilitoris]
MTQIAAHRPCASASIRTGNWFQRRLAAAHQRRELARLDDRALQDIGITRSEALTEASRPFWDAPETWRKRP